MKTIKIAPSADEVIVKENGHIFEVEFNGLRTEFVLKGKSTLNEECWDAMKKNIQQAIGLSSRPWQVKRLLDGIKTTKGKQLGTTNVYDIVTGIRVSE